MTDKADLLPCPADMLAMAEKLDMAYQNSLSAGASVEDRSAIVLASEMLRALAAPTREAELREALKEARKVLVVACGETAPYIKIALSNIDSALSGSAPVQGAESEYERLVARIKELAPLVGKTFVPFPDNPMRLDGTLKEKDHG